MFARGHYRLYNDILLVTDQRTGFIKRLKENIIATGVKGERYVAIEIGGANQLSTFG